jgi:alpha-tubulin suppressor-like RCC1 family protein
MSCLPQRLKPTLLALVGALGFWSCDNSSPQAVAVVDAPGTSLSISVPDSSCFPDSIAWSTAKESGTAKASGTPAALALEFHPTGYLNRDTVRLEFWTLGLRTRKLLALSSSDGHELTAIAPMQLDSTALRILSDFRGWWLAHPDSLTIPGKAQKTDLVKFCARQILSNGSTWLDVVQAPPAGLSTDSVRLSALASVLQRHLPLYTLAPCFASAYAQSLWLDSLFRQGRIQPSDTVGLNASSIRIVTPVALQDSLQVGGSAVGIAGSFAWPKGLHYWAMVAVRSWRGLDSCVRPVVFKAPSPSDTTWSLAGNLSLQASGCAESGSDTLVLTLADSLGHALTARIPFGMIGKAQPPQIVRISPLTQTGNVLPYEHDTLEMSWKVLNWRELDMSSVKIQNMSGFRENDSTWTAWVKLDAVGQTQAFTFRARSMNGLEASDFIEADRAPDTTRPTIVWKAPLGRTTLAYENLSYHVSLVASDFSGVDSVKIGGILAVRDTSGTWNRDVAINANGRDTTILVSAWDAWGNVRRDSCVLRRQTATSDILPTLEMIAPHGTDRFIPLDSDSVTVVWKIWSPYGIDTTSVRCNGLRGRYDTKDSTWTTRLTVPPTGQAVLLTARAYDQRGKSQTEQAAVVRARDTIPPNITNATSTLSFPFESVTATLAIRATDNHKVASVALNAEILSPNASGIYNKVVSLKVGKNAFPITATDSLGNVKHDTLYLTRNAGAPQHALSNQHFFRPLSDSLKFSGNDGDSLTYSLDGVNWIRYRTPIAIDAPTTIYAKAFPGGAIKALTIGQVRNPFTSAAVGIASSYFLKGDSLWAMGDNYYGQLNLSGSSSYSTPTFVMAGVAKVSTYSSSTLILLKNGYVYAVGANTNGCLGTGTTAPVYTPKWVANGIKDVQVSSGFSLLLTQAGYVLAAGDNTHGQLGQGAGASRLSLSTFTYCSGLSKIAGISVGEYSSFAWTSTGQSYACGYNSNGMLGTNDTTYADTSVWLPSLSNVQDIQSTYASTLFLLTDGSLYAAGVNISSDLGALPTLNRTPIQIQSGVSRIYQCYLNYYYLKGSTLWGMGNNSSGVLGQPTSFSGGPVIVSENVKDVFPGDMELMMLRTDGSIWVLGYNAANQFGTANPQSITTPTLIDF